MPIDRAALLAGSIRLASGGSFLVDPLRANRLWGEPDDPGPSTRLLLRSMGYATPSSADCSSLRRCAAQTRAAGSWRPGVPTPPTCWVG